MLDALVPWARGWIDHYRSDKTSTKPIGRAITQLRAGIPPPVQKPERHRFAGGEYAEYIEH